MPSDIEPYPSDEAPVTDYGVVQTVLDDAFEQGIRDASDDTVHGKSVFWEVRESTSYEIEYEFEDIEGNGERPQYFNHDGEVVALKFDIPD